jgi:hypothetical protein
MKMGFISVMLLSTLGNAQAGLFDTMDSVGAIQSQNPTHPNREPAAAPNANAVTPHDELAPEEPKAAASKEAQKVEKPAAIKTKKKTKH